MAECLEKRVMVVHSRAKEKEARYLSNVIVDMSQDPDGKSVSNAAKYAEAAFQWAKVRLMTSELQELPERAIKLRSAFEKIRNGVEAKRLGGKRAFAQFGLEGVFDVRKWNGRFDDYFTDGDLERVIIDTLTFMTTSAESMLESNVKAIQSDARQILKDARVEASTRALVMATVLRCRVLCDATFTRLICEHAPHVRFEHRGFRIDAFWGKRKQGGHNVYGRLLGALSVIAERFR